MSPKREIDYAPMIQADLRERWAWDRLRWFLVFCVIFAVLMFGYLELFVSKPESPELDPKVRHLRSWAEIFNPRSYLPKKEE